MYSKRGGIENSEENLELLLLKDIDDDNDAKGIGKVDNELFC